MQLRLKNEADCLAPQHTELRGGHLRNPPRLAGAPYRASGFVLRPGRDDRFYTKRTFASRPFEVVKLLRPV